MRLTGLGQLALALLASCVYAAGARAALVTADDVGTYFPNIRGTAASHNPHLDFYLAGEGIGILPEARNFFVFDLSSFDRQVAAAALHLSMPRHGYLSVDDTETFSLFDVDTEISMLTAGGRGAHLLGVFADLGSGASYGSVVLGEGDEKTTISIDLSAGALVGLTAALGGKFAIGGAVTSIGNPLRYQLTFALAKGADNVQLELTFVPLPGAAWLFVSGLVLIALRAWRVRGR